MGRRQWLSKRAKSSCPTMSVFLQLSRNEIEQANKLSLLVQGRGKKDSARQGEKYMRKRLRKERFLWSAKSEKKLKSRILAPLNCMNFLDCIILNMIFKKYINNQNYY